MHLDPPRFAVWLVQLRALQVSIMRAMAEGAACWLALSILALVIGLAHIAHYKQSAGLVSALAWLILLGSPAWRIKLVPGTNLILRLTLGAVRLPLLALAVALNVWILAFLTARLGVSHAGLLSPSPGRAAILAALAFMPSRVAVVILVQARLWVRSYLRNQLLVSHMAVTTITLVGLTAVASLVAVAVVALAAPDVRHDAMAVADAVRPPFGTDALQPRRVQDVLDALDQGRVRPESNGSPILLLLPWRDVSVRTIVLDPHGQVLGETIDRSGGGACRTLPVHAPLPPAFIDRLRSLRVREVAAFHVPPTLVCGEQWNAQSFAAAPIYSASGTRVGYAVVQGYQLVVTSSKLAGEFLVGFTAATLLVILATVLPTLLISAIASYLFARGLTRRLVVVSRTANALAAGDLSQRVPVDAENEIGRLATDFNRMAAHLETTMADLRRARTQAEQALLARKDLMASVSHELRTPIAVVQAHLDTLQMSGDGTKERLTSSLVEDLRGEMQRLATLVDDLFALTRADTEALAVQCQPTDLSVLVREVAALLRPLVQRERAVTLTVDAPSATLLAMADADRLRQILANLVRNAVRHTPEGGIIVLAVERQDPWLVLVVADTGEGIPPEHLPHIFDRFYRVDSARSRDTGGSGLGLAIVREFVELMGGKVTVESTLREGSCFRVFLPRAGAVAEPPSFPLV